jgi:hypothetical protein
MGERTDLPFPLVMLPAALHHRRVPFQSFENNVSGIKWDFQVCSHTATQYNLSKLAEYHVSEHMFRIHASSVHPHLQPFLPF